MKLNEIIVNIEFSLCRFNSCISSQILVNHLINNHLIDFLFTSDVHIRAIHKSTQKKCAECDFQTLFIANLKDHIRKVHRGEADPCPHCGKVFKRLDKHVKRVCNINLNGSVVF